MSTTFDEREKAFENKFKNDEETKFRVNARAVRILGVWAAGKMGMTGKAAEDYAANLVDVDFQEAGPEDIFRQLRDDFANKSVTIADREIETMFVKCLADAKTQLMST